MSPASLILSRFLLVSSNPASTFHFYYSLIFCFLLRVCRHHDVHVEVKCQPVSLPSTWILGTELQFGAILLVFLMS